MLAEVIEAVERALNENGIDTVGPGEKAELIAEYYDYFARQDLSLKERVSRSIREKVKTR